jgi:2-amino-4-hydroxy-6-hydroxymethyldihydropteridine diphosphokinase
LGRARQFCYLSWRVMQVFLGLGTNLGDREANLVQVKDELLKRGVLTMLQSSVLETEPLGGEDQPMYLNQVIECETDLLPMELLRVCQEVEIEMGRPEAEKGEGLARVIDVDILFYGQERVALPGLTIPHPRAGQRDFVVSGMEELAPGFLAKMLH